jgi:hypothetical protein
MLVLYPYKNALWALRLCNRGRLLSVRPAPTLFDHLYASLHRAFGRSISASLPKPQTPSPWEGLCMLGWLCVLAKPFGIHARHPCRGYITGATAPSPCRGLCPKARMLWLLAKSFARCKTSRASNTRHPIFDKQEVYRHTYI